MTAEQRRLIELIWLGLRWAKCSRCGDVFDWNEHRIPDRLTAQHIVELEIEHAVKGCNGALYEYNPAAESVAA